MKSKTKRTMKKATRSVGNCIAGIISTILKIAGTILLVGITSCVIFVCIAVMYLNNNLTTIDVKLEELSLNLSSTIYYKDNSTGNYEELVTLVTDENRIWVDYEDIPIDLEHAVVAIEDKRFYSHHGVDWYRTAGAFVNMFLGMKDTFGGSTITQQLIKNLTEYDDVTIQRKLTEIFTAIEFEKNYSKEDIIESYLNVVYFGHGRYGIGAAAEFYFGKTVSELSLAEMCSIVGITNNPSLYSPYVSPENNKARQETILDAMYEQGYITLSECEAAKAEELNFQPWNTSTSTGVVIYSYYVDAIIDDVLSYFVESRGVSSKTASDMLYYGGYSIYACIDMDIQEKVDSVYQDLDQIPATTGSNQQLNSGIVIMDPYTGDIVALEGGVGEKTVARGINWATSSLARRPVGSAIKPISVYAPAMDLGLITPDTTFEDAQDIELTGTDWFPYNDDRQNRGVVTVRDAIVQSLNTISAQVLDLLTPQVSYDFVTNVLGLDLEEADNDYAPLASGQLTVGTTARAMASAYTIFPSGGIYTEGRTFSAIYDSDGVLVYDNVPVSRVAISDTTAYWMTSMLTDAVNEGTGTSARLSNMPVAGKTGTTSDNKDRWFAGYTPYYVCVVWTGYEYPEKISTSGNPAAILWNKVMTLIHEDLDYKTFSVPTNTYQEPVPGVGSEYDYYVRCISVNSDGGINIIFEELVGSRVAGRTVTVEAPVLDGYDLISPVSEVEIVISEEIEDNVVEFIYASNNPDNDTESDEPTESDEVLNENQEYNDSFNNKDEEDADIGNVDESDGNEQDITDSWNENNNEDTEITPLDNSE